MPSAPNIRARSVGLLVAETRCPACGRRTAVFALAFPPGHEQRDDDGEDQDTGWFAADTPLVAHAVQAVTGPALGSILAAAPLLHADEVGEPWLNHCEHCGCSLDDAALHAEPGAAFVPTGVEQALGIRCLVIEAACSALAGAVSFDPPWFESFEPL